MRRMNVRQEEAGRATFSVRVLGDSARAGSRQGAGENWKALTNTFNS